LSLKDLIYTKTQQEGILISVEGSQKTGKTELGLSLPDPLYILDLNLGLEGVIEKYVKAGRTMYVKRIQIPFSAALPGQAFSILATAAADKWKEAILSLQEAIQDKTVKSIFIDTGSELWDLLRIARLGKLAQVLPIQYASVNAEYRQLLQLLLCSGKNVVLSHKVKPEYVNDQKTNRFERAGFGDVGFDVQVELRSERDLKKDGDEQFTLTFMDCRANKNLKGEVLMGKDANFLNVVSKIFPESDLKSWC
jgi:hypothetical protein